MMFVGIDTGGTFTDFVLWHRGQLRVHKVLSTPEAPERAILLGLAQLGLAPEGLHIAPFGAAARDLLPEANPTLPQDLLFAAQFAEPALWRGDVCIGPARMAVPGNGIGVPAPWAHLLPSFDIDVAHALIRLVGGKTVLKLP